MTDSLFAMSAAGERIPVELEDDDRSSGVEAEDIGEQILTPFDPDMIEVQTRNPTVALLLNRIRRGTLDLAPDFQRRAGIWTTKAQSRLIESLLLRITLPTLYAAEGEDDSWAIVDGVQRLSTIARFVMPEIVGEDPLRLTGLEYLTDYNGSTFDELPGRLQTRIEETELVVLLIRRGTPEEVKFNIFARINTGGRPLTRQELRHALIPGRARTFLAELAALDSFHDATNRSVSSERMSDREMCLRYLAFLLTPPNRYGGEGQDFDGFLRGTMHEINKLSETELSLFAQAFADAMWNCHRVFGLHAFRKQFRASTRRSPVNKALFEAQAVALTGMPPSKVDRLAQRAEDVSAKFVDLMDDPVFFNAISAGTGDVNKVRLRFNRISTMLHEVLGA